MGITAYLANHDPVFITSWRGYQAFVDALTELGAEKFPTILDQLPDGDEGVTSPQKAADMLQELEAFDQAQEQLILAVLVDTERSIDISMGSNLQGGVLSIDRTTGYDLGFDEAGFFIHDRWEMNRVLFKAMRVQQTLLDPEADHVEYLDLDSGQLFRCNVPFGKSITSEDGSLRMLLQRFHVDLRPMPSNRFAYIIAPLRTALEISTANDEPISWR